MVFELKPLPYKYDALEPYMDEQTLRIHHGKHHQGYVTKLNKAVEGTELASRSVEELVKTWKSLSDDKKTVVRNNAGGTWAHDFFWESMIPNAGGQPGGELAEAINKNFGSFDAFKDVFTKKASTLFGSGWCWLVLDNGMLSVVTTGGHDCPITEGKTSLLVIDVWEHAYYLKYQNKRSDFIGAWWSLVNWKKVEERFTKQL